MQYIPNAPADWLIDQELDFADAVADWFLDEADQNLANDAVESSLRNAHIAASVLTRQNRRLTCARLEHLLQRVADRPELEAHCGDEKSTRQTGKKVCLHVLEEALPAGGLTAMAVRWIENDSVERVHCVALVAQQSPLPQRVLDATQASGGEVWSLGENPSFVERAAWLRGLALHVADVVILHVGVSDTVFGAAFGRSGGPPVLLVNHAAHIFWVGSTIADVIVNCRGSDLETRWAHRHRGAPATTVPIPLPAMKPALTADPDMFRSLKAGLGVPESAKVLLTVGASFKYGQTERLDFLAAIKCVLERVADAHLVAVGVVGDVRWASASAGLGGRIHTLGLVDQTTLARLHAISDVYVEGFPFGTTTSLLEAGLRGVPVVLAPAESPPPYGSDGVALDAVLVRPPDMQAYRNAIVSLLESADERRRLGDELAASIRKHHTGSGWQAHLHEALQAAPQVHAVRPALDAEKTSADIYRHWAEFIDQTDSPYAESLEHAVVRAMLLGLRPTFTEKLAQQCRQASLFRGGRSIHAIVLEPLLNRLLPLLPVTLALPVFRLLAFLCRSRLTSRTLSKLLPDSGKQRNRNSYAVYHDIGR
ncbi:glycosyltransferase family 4 protein [Rhizobacter fulvus]